MIVDKVWKLTNTVCSYLPPLSRCVTLRKFDYFFVFLEYFFHSSAKMVKRNEKTNTGEGDKDKRGRTASDDTGVKCEHI